MQRRFVGFSSDVGFVDPGWCHDDDSSVGRLAHVDLHQEKVSCLFSNASK